jgi:hypothetical protein
MNTPERLSKLGELLYQALEIEMGGEAVYAAALACACSKDLKTTWEAKLEDTGRHRQVLVEILEQLGLDSNHQTAGRKASRRLGDALVSAIERAARIAPETAELMAIECVTLTETRQRLSWERLGQATQVFDDDAEPMHM